MNLRDNHLGYGGWILGLVGIAVVVSGAALWLGAVRRAAQVQLDTVQQATANMYSLSALEWQAIASNGVDEDLRERAESTIETIRADGVWFAANRGVDGPTVAALDGYVTAVERELDLLGVGELEAAIEIDEAVVDPLFDQLIDTFVTVADTSRNHAGQIERVTTVALVFAIAAGVTFSGYTVRQIGRTSRTVDLLSSKDRFIASVSHELRTPLTAVLGFSEILRDDFRGLGEAERIEIASTIAREAYDLAGIVEDLLVAARTEVGTIHISRMPLDLKANAAQVLETLPDEHRSRVRLGDQPNAMRAWGDPVRLRQVVRNLVSNALRYGGDNVRVDFEKDRDHAIVSVADDGPGLPDVNMSRIFLPYETAHGLGSMPSSVGLGLTVTRQLVELMGGSVTHRREKGSTVFEVRLPSITDFEETAAGHVHQAATT